jgi:preprotein translocase subunit SecE
LALRTIEKRQDAPVIFIARNVRERTDPKVWPTYAQAMKTLLLVFALMLAVSAAALAQVNFDSGSATPKSLEAARYAVQKAKMKRNRPSVRCRDGTVSYSRQNVCTGHGGAR